MSKKINSTTAAIELIAAPLKHALEKVMEMRERARKQRAEAMKLAESVKEDVIDIDKN